MSKETQRIVYATLGLLFGVMAKYFDSWSVVGIVFSEISVWIFISCLIAYFSKNAKNAAVNTLLFFACMLAGYYLYTIFILHFIPDTRVLVTWGIFALFSPLWGAILTFGRDAEFLGAFCSALPVALLLSNGYTVYYTFHWTEGMALLFGIIVFFLFNKTKKQKWQSALATAALFLIFYYLDVFSILLGGL